MTHRPVLLAYTRKSRITDPTTSSPARQRDAIERWAAANGPFDVEHFEDLDISGRLEENRPGWQRLLVRLDDPEVWGVAVEDWRASHRNVAEFLRFQDRLETMSKRIVSVNHPQLNPASADGRMLVTNLMAIAEWESRKASERIRAQLAYHREHDRRHIGAVPFGCDRHPRTKHLIPTERVYWFNPRTDQARAAAIDDTDPPAGWEVRRFYDALRAMFEIYSTGESSHLETSEELNAAGWRNWSQQRTVPKLFNKGTVQSALKHWYVYAGMLEPDTPAGHDPILPVDLCYKVKAALDRRALGRPAGPRGGRVYLLSSLLRCAECGHALSGSRSFNGYKYYSWYRHSFGKGSCSQRATNKDVLERQVVSALDEFIKRGSIIKDLAAELRAIYTQAQAEASGRSVLADLERKQAEMERLIDIYQNGPISRNQFDRRFAALQAEIAELESRLGPVPNFAVEESVQEILKTRSLKDSKPAALQQTIASIFSRLDVYDGAIVSAEPAAAVEPLAECCELVTKPESYFRTALRRVCPKFWAK